jgi:hypothetical protein
MLTSWALASNRNSASPSSAPLEGTSDVWTMGTFQVALASDPFVATRRALTSSGRVSPGTRRGSRSDNLKTLAADS